MGRIAIPLAVELDSGETFEVVADQRDLAALEAQENIASTSHTRARFLAWSAANRTKRYTGSWEKFNTVDAVEVGAADDDEAEDEGGDGLDPGRSRQSAGG
jgi:hypothetical protein